MALNLVENVFRRRSLRKLEDCCESANSSGAVMAAVGPGATICQLAGALESDLPLSRAALESPRPAAQLHQEETNPGTCAVHTVGVLLCEMDVLSQFGRASVAVSGDFLLTTIAAGIIETWSDAKGVQ
jgi:hypothetical protein